MCADDESRAHAEEWFMASIRAQSTYAPAFTSLGIAYESTTPPDHTRALKCFQKAFELDATEADAARRLAMGYADDDEWASVRTIAVRVMEGEGGVEGVAGGDAMNAKGRFAPRNGWAWKALGSTEMVSCVLDPKISYANDLQALQELRKSRFSISDRFTRRTRGCDTLGPAW
jgi:superkiller protein 3